MHRSFKVENKLKVFHFKILKKNIHILLTYKITISNSPHKTAPKFYSNNVYKKKHTQSLKKENERQKPTKEPSKAAITRRLAHVSITLRIRGVITLHIRKVMQKCTI